jgi:hypothetical protein
MKKSGSSNQLSLQDDGPESLSRDREWGVSAPGSRSRDSSPVKSRGRAGSESPKGNTEKTPKTPFTAHLASSSTSKATRSHRSYSNLQQDLEISDETTPQPTSSKMRHTRSSRSISQMALSLSPTELSASIDSAEASPRALSSAAAGEKWWRRSSSATAPMSLAETLKAAIDEGMPSAKPLSSLLLSIVSVELVLQLLAMLLLLSSALLPCELPIEDCAAMTVVIAISIAGQVVLSVKLQRFNFSSDHINLPGLLRDAETLSDEVRNVHLNKSISTIAVQRERNGVISYERNMAAVVPVNSVVKFHPSEKNNLPVAITEISNARNGSRYTYASVSQNLAVDCLKRLLQRRPSPSFDPLTHNVQLVLNRFSWLLIAFASVFLFAFVRAPVSDLSVTFRSIAVILMPLFPTMMSLSLSLSVAVINASISSLSSLSSSSGEGGGKRLSLTYSRLEEPAPESSSSAKWFWSSCISRVASGVARALQVSLLPAVSDDNQNTVQLSLVSVTDWLFNAWNRIFHEFNHMHMMSRITVFCVLDKEGILAQPQPEAKYVMHSRAVAASDAAPPRMISRTLSALAADVGRSITADVVDASFVTIPINQNDNGKWEFRFESEPEKKRSLDVLTQMSVCAQLTTDKLDIDEDAPKPANACVKGLGDLCTLINGLSDDKNVPVHDKVPIWKNYVDAISPGTRAFFDNSFHYVSRHVARHHHIVRSTPQPLARKT